MQFQPPPLRGLRADDAAAKSERASENSARTIYEARARLVDFVEKERERGREGGMEGEKEREREREAEGREGEG